MSLRDDIAATSDPAERQRIKAQAVAAFATQGRTITRGPWTVAVTRTGGAIQPRAGRWAVELDVRITKGGADRTPPGLNPVRLFNPPLMVPDPAGAVAIDSTWVDRVTGQEVTETHRYRIDPQAALLAVLIDLVRGLA